MRRVYEKCGYRHEGTARKLRWRNGRWHDAERYAILEEDYFPPVPPPAPEFIREVSATVEVETRPGDDLTP
jgi:hypothetical protein